MPTVLLKLLALSGVISAGCFAVWKANSELQPVEAADPTQFVSVEGEQEKNVGLGGQVLPDSSPSSPETEASDTEAPSTAASFPPADSTEPAVEERSPAEPHETEPLLAMADTSFAKEMGDDEPSTPRGMPAEFPSTQDEPAVAAAPGVSDPEPGVASLEALEAAEADQPEARVRTQGAALPKTVVRDHSPLQRVPAESGSPILMTTPKPTPPKVSAAKSSSQIIPANAELADEGGVEYVPEATNESTAPGVLILPQNTPNVVPAADEAVNDLPATRPQPARTRGPAIESTSEAATAVEDESNAFGSLDEEPAVEAPADEEPEAAPSSIPPRDRFPSEQPTLIDGASSEQPDEEPSQFNNESDPQPTRAPRNPRAIDEGAANAPANRSSIPRAVTEDMLVGDAVVEDPLITPSQQPQLRIEKKAQAEAEVGEKFVYEIIVENVGQVAAQHVVVEERIAKGCKMLRSNPVARLGTDRVLRWELGTLAPGTQKPIKVEVLPLEAGPVGSVATVRFAAQVATKTIVTAPTLTLSIKNPQEVAVGEQVPVKFVIENKGTGIARKGTLIVNLLQEGLTHPAQEGSFPGVKFELDQLAPGQSKEIDLVLTAAEQGRYSPSVVVTSNGIEQDNRTLELSVIESRLTLSREGHARRFVNRPAEFVTKVTNHSVEVMRDVTITEQLPVGVTPVGEMGKFRWNSQDHTVTWRVSELGPNQFSDLKLTVVSDRAGSLAGKIKATDSAGHKAELGTQLEVQGFSALSLDIQGDGKAVAIGDQVSMRVTVGNKGSAPAKNVQAVFEIPPQMVFVDAKGPSQFKHEGNLVTFAELEGIDANSSQTYDIVLTAAEEGRPSVAIELMSAERPEPVRQEEVVTITP